MTIEKVIEMVEIVEIAEDRRSDIIKSMRCAEIIIQVFDVQRPSQSTFFKGYWHSKCNRDGIEIADHSRSTILKGDDDRKSNRDGRDSRDCRRSSIRDHQVDEMCRDHHPSLRSSETLEIHNFQGVLAFQMESRKSRWYRDC